MKYFQPYSACYRLCTLIAIMATTQLAYAADLMAIIQDAAQHYPVLEEARINYESAEAQTAQYKLLHMPVFGAQARQNVNDQGSSTAITGKLNLYSGGAIEERITGSQYQEQYQSHKVDEAGEEIAYEITNIYLQGLSAKQQLAMLQRNYERHQKVIDNLEIVVSFDEGRGSDLLQAQSRQLQVKTRMTQAETELKAAESKLRKYLSAPTTIEWQALTGIENASTDYSRHPTLLAQYAEEARAASQAKLVRKQQRPQLDLDMVGGPDRAANLVLSWNFFDLSTGKGEDLAQNDVRIAKAKTEAVRRTIDERVTTSLIEVEQARKSLQGMEAQIQSAERVAEAYEQQFMIARRSILDVLNAYSELSNVELAKVSAQTTYLQALVSSRYAAGQLLQWALAHPTQAAIFDSDAAVSASMVTPTATLFTEAVASTTNTSYNQLSLLSAANYIDGSMDANFQTAQPHSEQPIPKQP